MNRLFRKLNFKDQKQIIAINTPPSFQVILNEMVGLALVIQDPQQTVNIEFVIAFMTQQYEIDRTIRLIAPKLAEDAIVWFCYPKGSSKKYKCDFNRDTGWEIMGNFGMEAVRQVAIDEDWSALRFRAVRFISKITRRESFALTEEAKKRTINKGK